MSESLGVSKVVVGLKPHLTLHRGEQGGGQTLGPVGAEDTNTEAIPGPIPQHALATDAHRQGGLDRIRIPRRDPHPPVEADSFAGPYGGGPDLVAEAHGEVVGAAQGRLAQQINVAERHRLARAPVVGDPQIARPLPEASVPLPAGADSRVIKKNAFPVF